MIQAFLVGSGAAATLLIGAFIVMRWRVPKLWLGLITALGVGVLISAVSFELIDDAAKIDEKGWIIAAGLATGAATFFAGNLLVERIGEGRGRKSEERGSPLAIVIGTILDAIPESVILGLSLVGGGALSVSMLVAVFISNLPEAIAGTASLRKASWKPAHIFGLWTAVVIMSGLASLLGYSVFGMLPRGAEAFTMSFAAGALLTMLADAMMPEAYKESGSYAGLMTVLGFALAFFLQK